MWMVVLIARMALWKEVDGGAERGSRAQSWTYRLSQLIVAGMLEVQSVCFRLTRKNDFRVKTRLWVRVKIDVLFEARKLMFL